MEMVKFWVTIMVSILSLTIVITLFIIVVGGLHTDYVEKLINKHEVEFHNIDQIDKGKVHK